MKECMSSLFFNRHRHSICHGHIKENNREKHAMMMMMMTAGALVLFLLV